MIRTCHTYMSEFECLSLGEYERCLRPQSSVLFSASPRARGATRLIAVLDPA